MIAPSLRPALLPFAVLGRVTLARAREAVGIGTLFYAALKGAALERRRGRRVVGKIAILQVYFTAVEPLGLFLLIALVAGFSAVVAADGLMRPNGLAPHVPAVVAHAIVVEVVPFILALIAIGRTGPAIATEIGYMRVNQEMDSLDVTGINTDYLVVLPRIVGVTVAIVSLAVAMSAVALFGGFVLAQVLGLVSVGLRFDQILLALGLPVVGWALLKATLFGLVISTVNCFHGLAVKASFVEIPRANVRGAVTCYLTCFVLNFAVSAYAIARAM